MSNGGKLQPLQHLPRQKVLAAIEPEPRRSTRHISGLYINISTLLLKRLSRRTRHDLQGIYAKGIRVDLRDAIDCVLGCVETLQPMTPHQTTGSLQDGKQILPENHRRHPIAIVELKIRSVLGGNDCMRPY